MKTLATVVISVTVTYALATLGFSILLDELTEETAKEHRAFEAGYLVGLLCDEREEEIARLTA